MCCHLYTVYVTVDIETVNRKAVRVKDLRMGRKLFSAKHLSQTVIGISS
jgi:hypothetical protein